eukprot:TRINITY_DN22726_c0_g1_i1.p1 TRINITY_DN22726_c0_g1~~TRINITY_DN22726_c0_g1_i1.p1  ORF type:complete len:352 (+),score=108.39 TRINITY_DN22726_c0_g1_i1:85-1056(+)
MRAVQHRGARHASHSGSWYSADTKALGRQIGDLIQQAQPAVARAQADSGKGKETSCRAVISPHAGLSYSGQTAAHAFAAVAPALAGPALRRVFVIGPSHHAYFAEIRTTPFATFQTPLGDVPIDTQTVEELVGRSKGSRCPVGYLSQEQDEDEHSVEMQMPFIAAALSQRPQGSPAVKLVPMVVGHIDGEQEQGYGELLAQYLADPSSVFVISSDFCHWGPRFRYQYHWKPRENPDIGDAIIAMDHRAMELIEQQDSRGLDKYFEETGNTICGRHPIGILLRAMRHTPGCQGKPQFLHYSQSQRCRGPRDNTVSYASAAVFGL